MSEIKRINNAFNEAKSAKKRVEGASVRATRNDYSTGPRTLDPLNTACGILACEEQRAVIDDKRNGINKKIPSAKLRVIYQKASLKDLLWCTSRDSILARTARCGHSRGKLVHRKSLLTLLLLRVPVRKQKTDKHKTYPSFIWCTSRDSNPGPTD